MLNKGSLVGKIVLRKYDVLIPFGCQKCGACCRNFAPQIWAEDFPKIARYLKRPQKEIKVQHEECYRRRFTKKPVDCSFLNEKTRCMIYPLRPEGCRLYPFTEFGTCGVNCPGRNEFDRIVEAFFYRREYAAMLWPGFRRKKDAIRNVSLREWPKLLKKFIQAQPSKSMAQKIFKINGVPKQFLKEITSVTKARSSFAGRGIQGSIKFKAKKEGDPLTH